MKILRGLAHTFVIATFIEMFNETTEDIGRAGRIVVMILTLIILFAALALLAVVAINGAPDMNVFIS